MKKFRTTRWLLRICQHAFILFGSLSLIMILPPLGEWLKAPLAVFFRAVAVGSLLVCPPTMLLTVLIDSRPLSAKKILPVLILAAVLIVSTLTALLA